MAPLPIEPVLPAIVSSLQDAPNLVLEAPPGAGKTTRVPLALLDASWLEDRKIIVVEPRRIAARGAARRMAETLNERVGDTIGWRMRLDTKVSKSTRIEVVTDGLFTRRLQQDPELNGIGAVLFDEFHERRLESDLGLAFCLEAQQAFRPDLRILAMSATLDGKAVAAHMKARIIISEGRVYPVETRYLRPRSLRIEDDVAAVVRMALRDDPGDILVFLPGLAEIRRTAQLFEDLPKAVELHVLHGDIGQEAQDLAIRPARAGNRKIVLASAIAETSVTIEGIGIVVDSGLMRISRHDPETGLTVLETVRVTIASADQRRGRAGRLGPGICYRLWPEAETRGLLPAAAPEIETADMAALALELALWGGAEDRLLTPPPRAAFALAQDFLKRLGALDDMARITPHGRMMAELGLSPRLAHMLIRAREAGLEALGADLAALLSDRDPLRGAGSDVTSRLEAMRGGDKRFDRTRQLARLYRRNAPQWRAEDLAQTGRLIAWAFPERIAALRPGQSAAYRLANGRGAELDPIDSLSNTPYLAVAELGARIHLAAALDAADIERDFASEILDEDVVRFDAREGAVIARRRRRLDQLVLSDKALNEPPREAMASALLAAIRSAGPSSFDWTEGARQFRARIGFLRRQFPDSDWPDWSDAALLDQAGDWLAPSLQGLARLSDVKRIEIEPLLARQLDFRQKRDLDRLAPMRIDVPSGSSIALDYAAGETPILAVKLQEMFGCAETPKIASGRVPILIHLLSPAGRPVQVTADLGGFWRSSYAAVRSEMRGRYPKHAWPEDPLSATPHRGAKSRRPQ